MASSLHWFDKSFIKVFFDWALEHYFCRTKICDKKQVYKPLLGCIGEFPTVALGGVLRFAGFLLMSFSATPVELLDS